MSSTNAIRGAALLAAALGAGPASSASLSDLVAGGALVVQDVTFDGFYFENRTGPGDEPFVPVEAGDVEVVGFSGAGSVGVDVLFSPAIVGSIFDPTSGFGDLFEFFVDFSATIDPASGRTFTGVALEFLGYGVTAPGELEVVYDVDGAGFSKEIEVFDFPPPFGVQTADGAPISPALTALALEGVVEGEVTGPGGVVSLSGYRLRFDLAGDPPVGVIPLPGALPMLAAALGGLAVLRRRRAA
jgi:hypothetical protein